MSRDEVRARVDAIAQRLNSDQEFRSRMNRDPEATLMSAGLGEEAAVILAEDWQSATTEVEGFRMLDGGGCKANGSCRFSGSCSDRCGWTATSLRACR